MSFLDKVTAFLPLGKKAEKQEYFFATNIGVEKITAALWAIEDKELKILGVASEKYSSNDEIATIVDKLLDQVLGLKEIEPQKILFGVPASWLSDDNLKDEYLKILRSVVKELELTPMAYVATSNALVHFLEKQEGVPTTAILVGFEKLHLTVTVARAGKIDGVKVTKRGTTAGSDIEKVLLMFTDVETLPSKILIYGTQSSELKSQLLSFSWMSKLSFLHFPKIEALELDLEIKSVCLAGGSEINPNVSYTDHPIRKEAERTEILDDKEDVKEGLSGKEALAEDEPVEDKDNFGFVVGDVENQIKSEDEEVNQSKEEPDLEQAEENKEEELTVSGEHPLELEDFEQEIAPPAAPPQAQHKKLSLKSFIPKKFGNPLVFLGIILGLALLIGAYVFLPKAAIKVFVEPKILEKDAQVVADPNQKTVNEDAKIIPGQIVDVEISGTAKDSASGKKQIGDPAKGTIVLYNKTFNSVSLSKGTQISGSGGMKFALDTSANIASESASDSGITFGKANTTVTASSIGADGNLPSGSDFSVAGYSSDKLAAKSEGNFSGGTSKEVTVVSSDDQQRLLAKLSSDLRQQAQQKLQEKYPNKKILQEALSESISKKSYSKNINDQAGEFSLNMTVSYKGTAFDDTDLRTIVSKLVNLQVPDGFTLDLSATETQADVSKLEKDGKLIFLARFKAKLLPRIDTDKIRSQIVFRTPAEAADILKGMDNVLGSEITWTPNLPKVLERLPILSKNIKIEVGLK
ncbi:MAG: hypothetical protein Q7R82_01795 [Candidatus Daviesbacteria bacterium]|nr:hypothetical protein [Candidatus Daviesbacteria bacterium]